MSKLISYHQEVVGNFSSPIGLRKKGLSTVFLFIYRYLQLTVTTFYKSSILVSIRGKTPVRDGGDLIYKLLVADSDCELCCAVPH